MLNEIEVTLEGELNPVRMVSTQKEKRQSHTHTHTQESSVYDNKNWYFSVDP